MRVNVAVSGLFHYHRYIKCLAERGVLNRFYYAHRLTTNSSALGIPDEQLVNVWIKEYLLQAHLRFAGRLASERAKPLYRNIWQYGALRKWSPCDLLHIMLHGAGHRMIARAKSEGSLVLGEPVNAHPEVQHEILEEERQRLGLPSASSSSAVKVRNRIIEEAAASDRLLAGSSFVKRSFVEKGFDPEKIDVLGYGVDTVRFSPLSAEERGSVGGRFRVVCVAGISVRKGHYDLLKAWDLFGARDAELVLIGRVSSEMAPLLRRYQGRFIHVPFVPNEELRKYLASSAVFVLPSVEDGCAVVCAEAMASGLPVITTQNNGSAELVDEGVNGYVVPIRSPEKIAGHLDHLYRHRELARQMGEAATQKAHVDMGWDQYAAKLIRIYESMLAST